MKHMPIVSYGPRAKMTSPINFNFWWRHYFDKFYQNLCAIAFPS